MARTKQRWTAEAVLCALRQFVDRHHRLPFHEEWRAANGLPSHQTFWRLCHSHAAVSTLLGLEVPASGRRTRPRKSRWHGGARPSGTPTAPATRRPCLRCAQPFLSTGPHHRLCQYCRRTNKIAE